MTKEKMSECGAQREGFCNLCNDEREALGRIKVPHWGDYQTEQRKEKSGRNWLLLTF